MNSFVEIVNRIASQWSDGMWLVLWQSTALAAVIYLLTLCIRRASAAACYWLWMLVPLRLLVMPLITISLPLLPAATLQLDNVDIEPVSAEVMTSNPAGIISPEQGLVVDRPKPVLSVIPEIHPTETHVLPNIWTILMTGWLVGFALCFARLFRGWHRIRHITAGAAEPNESRILESAQKAGVTLGLKCMPKILVTEEHISPFLFGVLRPVLVVPERLVANVRAEELFAVLTHEFAHLRRRDPLVGWLLAICEAIYFFHPIFYFVKRRILFERERACDNWVVASSRARRSVYANALITAADICRGFRTEVGPVGAVAESFGDLKKRLMAISRNLKPKARLSPSALVLLIILGAVCTPGILLTARAGTRAAPTQLHMATADGDIEQIKSLISKGVDVNAKDDRGMTPLHEAADYGQKEVAKVLIARGAIIDMANELDQTPLHVAAKFGSQYVPELLLAAGANVNARDGRGNTPLHISAGVWHINKALLELLLAKGADINAKNDKGQTPLFNAAPSLAKEEREHLKAVGAADFLLANSAEVNAKDKSGCTPLYVASGNGRKKVVKLLLAKGAIIDDKTEDGMTALHLAAKHGHKDVVVMLLKKGADFNARESHNLSALHFAAEAGYNSIVELFIAKGADVNANSISGETPAHLAAVRNHRDTVELLISEGAQVSTIQLAAYIGDFAKIKSFIEKGVSVNTKDGVGYTPLHAAAGGGHKGLIKFLVEKGGDVNTKGWSDGTPLHYATDGNHKGVVPCERKAQRQCHALTPCGKRRL
jgi:ankyrin repeat protein